MLHCFLIVLLTLSSHAPVVSAWGTMAHEAIGFIAQNFVSTTTESWIQGILDDDSDDYMAGVAAWADSYKYTSAGTFSKAYHYIDAHDNPPDTCNVNYTRDCGSSGCVVSAIANYTSRVQDSTLSDANLAIAMKMVIHFIGDIHQPLHDENLESGGNGISVKWGSAKTNLHTVWDTKIPVAIAGGSTESYAKSWATTLTTSIESGTYASSTSTWISDIDIDDAHSSSMDWATEANARVCDTVLVGGVDAVENVDLSGDYCDTAEPVVDELVAKAGYRLAVWLNLMATGKTGV